MSACVSSISPVTSAFLPRSVEADKPKRTEKPGTVRYLASLWRKAGETIRTMGHCKDGSYGGPGRGFCILGSVTPDDPGAWRNEAVVKGLDSATIPYKLANAVTGKDSVIRYSDTTTKDNAIRFCKGVAYMLEHGGRLPAWAQRIAAKRNAVTQSPSVQP